MDQSQLWRVSWFKEKQLRAFPEGLVVKTPCFHCRGCGFHLGSGN